MRVARVDRANTCKGRLVRASKLSFRFQHGGSLPAQGDAWTVVLRARIDREARCACAEEAVVRVDAVLRAATIEGVRALVYA